MKIAMLILAALLSASCATECATREEGSAQPARVKPSQAEIDAQQRMIEDIWRENREHPHPLPVHVNAETGKPWSQEDEQRARERWGK